MKIYQNPFRFDEHLVPKIIFTFFQTKEIIFFLRNCLNVAHTLISCFSKLRNFLPNFDLVFREISLNSREILRNKKLKISQKYRKMPKLRKRKVSQPSYLSSNLVSLSWAHVLSQNMNVRNREKDLFSRGFDWTLSRYIIHTCIYKNPFISKWKSLRWKLLSIVYSLLYLKGANMLSHCCVPCMSRCRQSCRKHPALICILHYETYHKSLSLMYTKMSSFE